MFTKDINIDTPPQTDQPSRGTKFARDVITLTSGSAIAQALVIIASPILTRLYMPEEFGVATLFLAIVMPISAVACLRYDMAIMLPKDNPEAVNILALSFFSALVISLSIAIAIQNPFIQDHIINALNAPNLLSYLWWIAPTILLRGIFSSLNIWCSRNKKFLQLSVAEVSASFGTISYQIIAAWKYVANSGSLILGYIFGSTLSTALLGYRVVHDHKKELLTDVSLKRMFQSARRYKKFPLFDIWGVLFNSISWQIPALMLAAFFSPMTVGYYALADRIVRVPMLLGGRAISKVFFQRTSEILMDKDALSILVENVFTLLIALSLLPALLLGLMGQDIIKFVFGASWVETGLFLQILSSWIFVWFISSSLSTLFIVFERQDLALVIHAAIFFTRLASFTIGGISRNVYIALGFFVGTGVIVYGILLLWSLKQAKISLYRMAEIFFRYFVYSMPVVFVAMILKYWLHAPILFLLITVLPLVILYYLYIYRSEHELLRNLGVIKSEHKK